jgi:diaminopimelate decarboxylase
LARVIADRYSLRFPILDVGGGLGVNYEKPFEKPDFESYGKFLKKALQEWKQFNPQLKCKVFSECGRALVSQAGFLLTKVIRIKKNPKKNFAIVDASMTELIRPALYNAFHVIEKLDFHPVSAKNVSSNLDRKTERYDVVGPVCESGDFLAQNIELPELEKGALLWVTCAGAYGYAMSSSYNLRALPAEYLLRGDDSLCLIRDPVKVWLK